MYVDEKIVVFIVSCHIEIWFAWVKTAISRVVPFVLNASECIFLCVYTSLIERENHVRSHGAIGK